MICIGQVNKFFGATLAVDNISLEIAAGEHLVLLGSSGSGKTTLLRMINGLVAPSSGTIQIHGREVRQQPQDKLRRQIGYVLQRNSLFPHYTVEENIAVVPRLLQWDKQVIDRRTRELMEQLHLPENYRTRRPEELSGGEAQRVNLARALAADPPVLLMDEPFSALDALTRKSIRNELMQLPELRKKTIVMVSHDIQEAFEIADTIALLHQGRMIQKGKPSELLYAPSQEFVKEFLGGEYLQLSFRTTRVVDLWDYLPRKDSDKPGRATTADNTRVWELMELLQHGHRGELAITLRKEHSTEIKQITWNHLMNAYCLFQNHKC